MKQVEQIRRRVADDFSRLGRDARRSIILNQDFAIAFQVGDISPTQKLSQLGALQELGMKFFGIDIIFAAIIIVCDRYNLEMPHSDYSGGNSLDGLSTSLRKTVISNQSEMVNTIFSMLRFDISDQGTISIVMGEGESETDITKEAYEHAINEHDQIAALQVYQGLMNRSLALLKRTAHRINGLGMIVSSPSQSMQSGPVIGVNGVRPIPLNWRRDADSITTGSGDTIAAAILRAIIDHSQMMTRREQLQGHVASGEVVLEPEFTTGNWPTHPLMNHIKDQAAPFIADETRRSGILCDDQDIKYQTLFRLTTLPFGELFENGVVLVERLREAGVYEDWRKIITLSPSIFETFILNENIVRTIVREQLVIIKQRLESSPLPVSEILTRSGIFAEAGWRMEKADGDVFAVRYDDGGTLIDRNRVRFEVIEPELASQFHHAFHYIHTPRTHQAYGFFLEGESVPFSVLATEPIDRPYKENMLLMQGYDPKRCIDLARLYSRPGTPFNTSSAIFSLTFAHIRTHQPEIQAVLSAFMPTYATGKSMLSGGFDHAVLIKPNRHLFGERIIGGQRVWEHLTKRRLEPGCDTKVTHPDMPMLPVVELMSPIKPPRFQPLPEINGKMVVCTE